jgi:hypothetical protein
VEVSSELGLFVLWSGSRFAQGRILADIQQQFEIRRAYDVTWSRAQVTANFARFYRGRAQPPYRAAFEEQKGRGPFLLVTVVDHSPHYQERETLKGVRPVNVRFFDAKMRYREWVGGSMRVHATDSALEARRDLTLLLGSDAEHYLQQHRGIWDGEIQPVRRDVVGAQGWVSRAQLIEVLGATVNYLALPTRPGESIALLTDDYEELVRVMNARPLLGQLPCWGGDFATWIGRGELEFQIRFVGDGYLDESLASSLLEQRVRRPGDFFRPCEEDARDYQAYHALVHRGGGARPPKAEVDALLERRGARYSLPRDPLVPVDFRALPFRLPALCGLLWSWAGFRWRLRHRIHRPFSIAWWRIREPMRRRVGWLRHLRPRRREEPAAASLSPADHRLVDSHSES